MTRSVGRCVFTSWLYGRTGDCDACYNLSKFLNVEQQLCHAARLLVNCKNIGSCSFCCTESGYMLLTRLPELPKMINCYYIVAVRVLSVMNTQVAQFTHARYLLVMKARHELGR